MISTVADLLEAFRFKEAEILDKQKINHAPTIGSMYEGLTRELLQKSLPMGLDLRVTSGFIVNSKGDISKQIDCMLVSGKGELIPYTEGYKYHIQNVIAVVEVKKNLYADEIDSAYKNLFSVRDLLERGLPENRLFNDGYRAILRSDPNIPNDIRILPVWKRQIGLALYIDSITPVRIALGYHGFSNELKFREAFFEYLERNVRVRGYGAADLPSLIVCDEYSLIKLNGMPYGIPVVSKREELYNLFGSYSPDNPPDEQDLWPLYASSSVNPMVLLLELVWTRLTYARRLPLDISFLFGRDLNIEIPKPLLLAKALERNGKIGWYYEYFPMDEEDLAKTPPVMEWQPVEISVYQYAILHHLMQHENAGSDDGLDVNSPQLVAEFQNAPESLDEAIAFLRHANLVFLENGKLRLLTHECKVVALPDGRFVAGEDTAGRFSNWLAQYMEKFKTRGQ